MTTTLGGDYPTTWDGFIGQDQAKRQLQIACKSAKTRGKPLDHVLIASGVPGIGKTSLAQLIAIEMGGEVVVLSGTPTVNEARIILSSMSDGDILFFDEVHRAVQGGKGKAEWLLHLLQDGTLVGPLGPEATPKITVIAATTDVGKLPSTIIDRFAHRPVLQPYSEQEGTEIALTLAARLGAEIDISDAARIAKAASNSPRVMRSLLVSVRDLLETEGAYKFEEVLDWKGLTEDGLTETCQRYLKVMLTDFQGQAGRAALMDRLQEPGGLLDTERLLQDKGLIASTKAGRTLTQAGIVRARALVQA